MEIQGKEMNLRDYGLALRRHRKLIVRTAVLILVPALTLAALLPAIYRSQAIILIEQQEIPPDLVRSTVTSFADQRIQVISQRVMTSTNLMRIVEKYELYSDERERKPRETVLEQMRNDISRDMISADVVDPRSGRPTEATIAFSLSFESESPQVAQRVTNELVSLYLNENIKTRTEAAAETSSFLTDEAKALRERVSGLENRLAEFKAKNADNQPELERVTREMLNRTELELVEAERRIHSTEQQKIFIEAELLQAEPYREVSAPGEVTAIEQLRATEAQLAAAEASYANQHPDVQRLRKVADGLRTQVRPGEARRIYEEEITNAELALATAQETYGPEHPDVVAARRKVEVMQEKLAAIAGGKVDAPNNPIYISLTARFDHANAELVSLEQQREELEEKVRRHLENLRRIPEVEATYRAISREYDSALAKYQEITAKQMEARLSENLETARKGEKFTLIEPPLLPEKPAKPNRIAIVAVGLTLALVGGIGSVVLAEALDTRVRGRRGVQELLTAPPLASIPYINVEGQTVPAMQRAYLVAGGLLLATLALLAAVHMAYKPLDVLWFAALRKIGI